MNSCIQPFSTAEAAYVYLAAAAADDSVATDAAYFASGVSILADAKGHIKAVSGEKKSDIVEASTSPPAAPVAVAVAPATSAAAVASAGAVAAPAVVLGKKR